MYQILSYSFEGPFPLESTNFNEVAAVYVILDGKENKIDVGETDNLKNRIATHERKSCWERSAVGGVFVAALVESDQETRQSIESKIRSSFNFSCGEE